LEENTESVEVLVSVASGAFANGEAPKTDFDPKMLDFVPVAAAVTENGEASVADEEGKTDDAPPKMFGVSDFAAVEEGARNGFLGAVLGMGGYDDFGFGSLSDFVVEAVVEEERTPNGFLGAALDIGG